MFSGILTAALASIGSIATWIMTNVVKPYASQILFFVLGMAAMAMLFGDSGCSCWYPGKAIHDRRERRQDDKPITTGDHRPHHPLRPWLGVGPAPEGYEGYDGHEESSGTDTNDSSGT